MLKDAFRFMLVTMFDGVGYSHDILAQRIEMGIAIYGAFSLINIF